MRYVSSLLVCMALSVIGPVAASADIVDDCYRATLENPVSNDKIISLCSQAVGLASGNRLAQALANRGIGYMQKGELDIALADLDESIRLNPNDLWVRSTRANVFRLKRAYDRALSELNEILRRDPTFIGAYVDRGMVHDERGDYQSARADFEAVLGMRGSDPEIERWAKTTARQRLDRLPR